MSAPCHDPPALLPRPLSSWICSISWMTLLAILSTLLLSILPPGRPWSTSWTFPVHLQPLVRLSKGSTLERVAGNVSLSV